MTNCTEQTEITRKLQAPFDVKDIEWRVQRVIPVNGQNSSQYKAIVCAYVTNRAIQSRLDEIVGPFNWKNEYREWRNKGVLCGISIKFGDEWVTKWDGADETSWEPTKGGLSSAMKRAAVQFGIGRSLYEVPEQWVEIKDRGDNFVKAEITVNNQKIQVRGYWDNPKLTNNNTSQTDGERSSNQQNEMVVLMQEASKLEKCLGLTNPQKVRIFQRVNPNTNVSKVNEIYKAGRESLNRYIDLIKAPAHIKKHIDNAKVDHKEMLNWLSDTYGENFTSYTNLITYVDQKTVDAVVVKLAQMKAA